MITRNMSIKYFTFNARYVLNSSSSSHWLKALVLRSHGVHCSSYLNKDLQKKWVEKGKFSIFKMFHLGCLVIFINNP